jgi:tRNA threonylcarbamoyladenosine biosynthesis protein TsaB
MERPTRMTAGRPLLLIDTATRRAVVGIAAADGTLLAEDAWESGHRHGEELLPRLQRVLEGSGMSVAELGGVAVGSGPGSFTGLRIGMATAKTICYSLRLPVVGLPTMELLARAGADRHVAVVLPAGVGDRYVARYSVADGVVTELLAPTLTPAAQVSGLVGTQDGLVAVDLEVPEVSAEALELGRRAQVGLAGVMAAEAARRLVAGESADLASLVPHYVALPRGVPAPLEEAAWSPDLR